MPANFTEQCSFCHKPRAEVRKLVAGPEISICDECVGLANGILVEEQIAPETRQATPLDALGTLMSSLPLPTSLDVLNQLTLVGLELVKNDSASLRRLSFLLGGAMAYERGLEVRARIPAFDRHRADDLSEGAYHTRLGATREALLAFERASAGPAKLTPSEEVICVLGRAQARLGARSIMPSEVAALLADADRAAKGLATLEVDPTLRRGLENQHVHIRVLALAAQGRHAEGAELLTPHLRERPGDVEGFVILAELCDRRGDTSGASAARERALSFVPRGSGYAARIHGRRS